MSRSNNNSTRATPQPKGHGHRTRTPTGHLNAKRRLYAGDDGQRPKRVKKFVLPKIWDTAPGENQASSGLNL